MRHPGLDLCEQLSTVPYPMGTETDLKETQRLVEALGRRAILRKGDVRSPADQRACFDEAVATFGHVDIAIGNAGVIISGNSYPDMQQVWDDALGIMLTGAWHTLQLAADHMRERRSGNIVLTSSVAGLKAFTDGSAGADAYTAAKTAIVGLVKSYAAFLGPYNVRVNAVAPTGVNTLMGQLDGQVAIVTGAARGMGAATSSTSGPSRSPSSPAPPELLCAVPPARVCGLAHRTRVG